MCVIEGRRERGFGGLDGSGLGARLDAGSSGGIYRFGCLVLGVEG